MNTKQSVRLLIFIALFLAGLAIAVRIIPGPRTIDDAYITFRYARNLLAGEGFVYNPGERILGTTTPLYTLIMACLGALFGRNAPYTWLALVVNALADAFTCLLLWQIGRTLKLRWAGVLTALAWGLSPFSVTFAIGGLETSLYILLLTSTVVAHLQRKHNLAALCAALSFLTRPDALILLVPLIIQRFLDSRRSEKIGLVESLTFLLPCLAWGLFATVYFGSPLPHSMLAKTLAYRLPPEAGLIRLLQHYAVLFQQHYWSGGAGIAVGMILFPFLFVLGARRIWQQEPLLRVYALYAWIYFAVFALANPLLFRWYLTPPLPPYFFFAFAGLETLLSSLFRLSAQTRVPAWRTAVVMTLLFLPLVSLLSAWQWRPDHGSPRPAPEMAFIKLELLYKQAVDYVLPLSRPDNRLAAGDVGVLGYESGLRILDTVGLNSPQTLDYYPLDEKSYVINYAIPTQLILDEKPDWLVILEVYGRKTLLQDNRFLREYQLLKTLPTDIYGSNGLLIFHRKSDS